MKGVSSKSMLTSEPVTADIATPAPKHAAWRRGTSHAEELRALRVLHQRAHALPVSVARRKT